MPQRVDLSLPLRTWMVLSHLVVLALPVVALVGTGALATDLRMQTREDLEHQATLLALLIEERASARQKPLADLDLSPLLTGIKKQTLAGFRVVDREGIVVASSGGALGEDIRSDAEVATALTGAPAGAVKERPTVSFDVPLIGRRDTPGATPLSSASRHADVRIFVAVPLKLNTDVVGALVLSRTPREEIQAFYHMAPRLSFGVIFALIGTIGLAFGAGRVLSRSLRSLAEASKGIAFGSEAALGALEPARRSRVAEARALAAAMGSMSARLRERLRYITEFAGNVSHEFKTPVSSLRGTIELIRDDDQMPPEQRARFLDNALADLDRLSRLVGGLLRLARAEEGGDQTIFSIDEVADEVARRVPGVTRSGVTPSGVTPSRSGGRVAANREQVESALLNLVENAARHGGPAVSIRVDTWTDASHVGVDVSDDGPGISPANLPRIFDRFFTTDRGHGGTGLGLALVKAVAEAHGGQVRVESGPGRTRFQLLLPRV